MSDESDNEPFPWQELVWEFELKNARVIATFGDDGGAIAETLPSLLCTEGRLVSTTYREEGEEIHRLEYCFSFAAAPDADPLASSSSFARVVICGTGRNGVQIEIRGDGWIGYDEKGNLEGRYDSPPVIITDDSDPEPYPETELTHEDIMGGAEVPMPPHYRRAIRRVEGPSAGEA